MQRSNEQMARDGSKYNELLYMLECLRADCCISNCIQSKLVSSHSFVMGGISPILCFCCVIT